jgi:hypothetical protein
VRFIVPEGTILNPSETAAVVGGNVLTSQVCVRGPERKGLLSGVRVPRHATPRRAVPAVESPERVLHWRLRRM